MVDRGAALAEEEAALTAGRRMSRVSPVDISGQDTRQVPADRYQSGLEELGVPDREQGIRQIHVGDRQVQRLMAAQAGPIQEQEDRSQGLRLDLRAVAPVSRDGVQQPPDLVP